MSLKKRFALVVITVAIQILYFPINRLMQGGVMIKTIFDPFPLWAVWVVPYMLWEPTWIICLLYAAWKMEAQMFRAFVAAMWFTMLSGLTSFVVYPTYIERPTLVGQDIFTEMLRWLYTNDDVYNAFPSGHLYIITVIALFYTRWHPQGRWVWIAYITMVSFSTLFTVQHYLPDIFGGIALGWIGYHVGMWWNTQWTIIKMRRASSRVSLTQK
jgi:membrane-associated phospholipid phosphatase